MNIDNTKKLKKTNDYFDDNFEVIYQEEDFSDLLREEMSQEKYDDYKDVLSNLSEMDHTDYIEKNRTGYYKFHANQSDTNQSENDETSTNGEKHKRRLKMPDLISPAVRLIKTGGKAACKVINMLLRAATLILIAVIACTLAIHFWNGHSTYGNLLRIATDQNYILGAYTAIALLLLLFELITFLMVLFGSSKSRRRNSRQDTGRGLFSFLFIYAGAYLANLLNGLMPASPAWLQGVQGALLIYGSLHSILLPLCIAGIISCLLRRFLVY